jgi:geranylgeranyl pyrophosphate synthase
MGKQFQQLMKKMRNQLMVLNQRVFKSGDNSAEDELIESAYLRTGKHILHCCFASIILTELSDTT